MINEILREGKEKALSWRYLCDALNLRTRRELWAAIAAERAKGVVILPDNQGGYYLPTAEDQTELEAWRHRMKSMARSTEAAAR